MRDSVTAPRRGKAMANELKDNHKTDTAIGRDD